jgi:CDP-4-dehydro-6-deoxyglucose reductase
MNTFTITLEPSQHTFQAAEDQNVLEAALAAGLVIPYSCRSGACSTCKGKILSGSFESGVAPSQILSKHELEQGYTLLCQIQPRSDLKIESREVRLASDIQIRKLPARIIDLVQPAPDVAVMTLQLPMAEKFRYYPGQYVDFLLKNGKRRSYSMANAPVDANTVSFHVRHIPGGVFTDPIFGVSETLIKVRDILRVEGPLGSFFLRDDTQKPIVFLASGTGFAPIKAIVEHMIANGIVRPVSLYWGGRRPADLYMNDLAQHWAQQLPHFQYIPVVSNAKSEDQWGGRTGFVHQAVLDDFNDLSGHEIYACGAPIVVESARQSFSKQRGMPDDAFFADAFVSATDVLIG